MECLAKRVRVHVGARRIWKFAYRVILGSNIVNGFLLLFFTFGFTEEEEEKI